MKRTLAALLVAVALTACSDRNAPTKPETAKGANANLNGAPASAPSFIVTVRDGVDPTDVARDHGIHTAFVYTHALNGFAGSIADAAQAGLLSDGRVERVELDDIATTQTTVAASSWGLDRIDQHTLPLSGTYTYGSTGTGVTAYIIDTGIDISNADFGGRASVGTDAIGDGQNGLDCNGHGTHVSGTVGGNTYGVARGVTLVAVRVLNCAGSGAWSQVIAGLDWVTAHRTLPAVANMSLSGGASASVDAAVKRMIAAGVATSVAAGNGNQGGAAQDACKSSPSRVDEAMTISATDQTDTKASWANYGNCVDWFAPGVGIKSDWLNGATATASGTSMASPHNTGVAALYLSTHATASPAAVRTALFNGLSLKVVKSSKTSNNHLLFTNY